MFIQLYIYNMHSVLDERERTRAMTPTDRLRLAPYNFNPFQINEEVWMNDMIANCEHAHSRRHIPRRCTRAIKHPNTICILIIFYFPFCLNFTHIIHFQPIELYIHTPTFVCSSDVCLLMSTSMFGWLIFRAPYNHRLCRCLGFLPILDCCCCCCCFLSCACIASYCGRP